MPVAREGVVRSEGSVVIRQVVDDGNEAGHGDNEVDDVEHPSEVGAFVEEDTQSQHLMEAEMSSVFSVCACVCVCVCVCAYLQKHLYEEVDNKQTI